MYSDESDPAVVHERDRVQLFGKQAILFTALDLCSLRVVGYDLRDPRYANYHVGAPTIPVAAVARGPAPYGGLDMVSEIFKGDFKPSYCST